MEAQEDFNNYFKLKRDQYLVEIRKGKNNRFLTAKRLKFAAASSLNDNPENASKDPPKNLTDPFEVQEYVNKLVSDLMQAIDGQDSTMIADAAERIRRTISQDDNPPLEPLLKTNIAPTFVNFLCPENYMYDKLIFEFSWILANIALGDGFYVQYLADLGLIPRALNLLQHESVEIKENAIHLLTNIAGESLEYRDQLLQAGIVDIIAYVYSTYVEGSSLTFLSELAWSLSVLSRNPPDFDQMTPILNIAHQLLLKNETKGDLSWVLRTFSNLSDGGNQQIQKILDLGCVEKIVSLLNPKESSQVITPALRTIGNLSTGTNSQVETLMKLDIIESVVPLLCHSAKVIRREAAWALSNIISAGEECIASVFNFGNGQILDRLFHMIDEEDFEVSKECTYCLTNVCLAGNIDQVRELVERDFIELLVETLKENTETKLLQNCLDALEAVLKEYKNREEALEDVSCEMILRRLANCGGYSVLEDLQKHKDDGIYATVADIIKNYIDFSEDEYF